jgi:hypothetical protein
MARWDDEKPTVKVVTLKKKQFERLLMLVGGVGVITGFAIYYNFFTITC